MHIEEIYKRYKLHPDIQIDSRKIKEGDIYFALKGPNFNGNHFANEALQKGAAFAIIDEAVEQLNDKMIVVKDVLSTLQELALYHRKQFHMPFIAITGSNGKTTTKELINVVLATSFHTYATEGNLNNHIGIPLTILKIKDDATMSIIEMGANHQKEIEAYCRIVLPTHAIITNCGKAHLEGFGGIEGVRKGKGELYDFIREHNGHLFRNADLDYLNAMGHGIKWQTTYGSANADIIGKPIMNGALLDVAILKNGDERLIKSNLVGEYNFPNIMAAVAIGKHFGISINQIADAIEAYIPDNSRSQLIKTGSNTIILDAYNANPTSMSAAIINFARTNYPNKYIIIGAMKELGTESIAEHQKIIETLEQFHWNDVVLVGGDFVHVNHPYTFFPQVEQANEWFKKRNIQHGAILVKGSRAFSMEKAIQA